MNLILKDLRFFNRKFSFPVILWFALAIIAVLLEIGREGLGGINNYLIFKNVFWHTRHFQNLYLEYPGEYIDVNHYGPFFSIIIAPFALLPDYIGCVLWCIANAWFLLYAIERLPVTNQQKMIIIMISAVEMMTSTHSVQFNPMLTAWIVLAFVLVEEKKDFWATLLIVAGFFVKIYGIVGVLFFLFSKDKIKFIGSFIFWMIILFCLPMIISSPAYIIQSYQDWFHCIVEKDLQNQQQSIGGGMQDISVMGMIKRIFNVEQLHNYYITIPAFILFSLPLLRFKSYKFLDYRMSYLALTLISVVILSSSAESPTYVIAVVGCAIWFILQDAPKSFWVKVLLAFVIILTSLSVTDLFPPYIRRNVIVAYALKALPCFVVWLVIVYQLLKKNFYGNNPPAAQ